MAISATRQREWTRMEGDLIETAHFLGFPVILIVKILKAIAKVIAFCLILSSWWLFVNVGWVINWGPHSAAYRQQYNEAVKDDTEFNVTDMVMSFGQHYTGKTEVNTTGMEYIAPVQVTMGDQVRRDSLAPDFPELCRNTEAGNKDTTYHYDELGPWQMRNRNAMLRKTAKMQLALMRAQVMSSGLREIMAELKHGAEAHQGYPSYTFCSVPVGTPELPKPEFTNSSDVILNHMPTIKLRYSKGRTVGMCLVDSCQEEDLLYKITRYDDLFTADPVMTDGQNKAIAALDEIGTLDFWLRAAHENGIHDRDDRVRLHWQESVRNRDAIIRNAEENQPAKGLAQFDSLDNKVSHWSEN